MDFPGRIGGVARRCGRWLVLAGILSGFPGSAAEPRWTRGLSGDPSFFPIAVWLQSPAKAARYRAAGINLYVGLWNGPTAAQLAELKAAGMPVICEQNAFARTNLADPTIVGWMHGDEPDNAQELPGRNGYGPPILPEVIVRDYQRIRTVDPSRPILLNLGQGVAWDAYIGRGVRRNHPEDYPEYAKGSDIVSFDIYPAVHDAPEVAGRLEFVARGVERLVGWAGPDRTVWNCIECTRISNVERKPTPAQVRSEVWMALVRGSRGLIYFVHQFKPVFREAALLEDAEMLSAVTAINREIRELAPVLNQPTVTGGVTVAAAEAGVTLAVLEKHHQGRNYLFAVNLSSRPTQGTFSWTGDGPSGEVEVLGESRRVALAAGAFSDSFEGYGVRRYRIGR